MTSTAGRKRGAEEDSRWSALYDAIHVDTTAFAVEALKKKQIGTPLHRKGTRMPDCRVSEAEYGEQARRAVVDRLARDGTVVTTVHDNGGNPFDVLVTVPENFMDTRLLEVAVYRRRLSPRDDRLVAAGVDEAGISREERKKRRQTLPDWRTDPDDALNLKVRLCGKDALRDKRLAGESGHDEDDDSDGDDDGDECDDINVGDKPPSYEVENVHRIFYGYGESMPFECPKSVDFWTLSCTALLELAPDENDEGRVTCVMVWSGVDSFKLEGPITTTAARAGRPKSRRVSGGRRARSPSPASRGKRKASPVPAPAETVVRYVSKVGNNDVPYHFLVTERNVYFTSGCGRTGSIPLEQAEKLGFTAARGGDDFALCPTLDMEDLDKQAYFTPVKFTQILPRDLDFDT